MTSHAFLRYQQWRYYVTSTILVWKETLIHPVSQGQSPKEQIISITLLEDNFTISVEEKILGFFSLSLIYWSYKNIFFLIDIFWWFTLLRLSACKEVLTLKRNYLGTEKKKIPGIISMCLTFCFNLFTSISFQNTLIAYQVVSFHM